VQRVGQESLKGFRGEVPRAAGVSPLTVLYDGGCPLCRREVAWYRGLASRCDIEWRDVAAAAPALPADISREQALARFHVVLPDGSVRVGAAAFIALWQQLTPLRILGYFAALPPLPWILELAYGGFLRVRPGFQRLVGAGPLANDWPRWLQRDLRSDHAGETGAVAIYRGVLAVTHDAKVRRFARRHLSTELRHLRRIERVLPASRRSRLLPAWRIAGWLTGVLPALVGPDAVYATVAAVETFVDQHYADQVERLDVHGKHSDMRALLERCRQDEVAHRDEAEAALMAPPGVTLRLWTYVVGAGSAAAVILARRI
jgi:demethoxyubiquinone hydroxylase (CLK1/Coq7/Cat5 family)